MDLIAAELLDAGLRPSELPDPGAPRPNDVWPIGLKRSPVGQGPRPVIVAPESVGTIQRVLPWAATTGRRVMVAGGRSNVVGALSGRADVVLDMTSLNEIRGLDEVSQMVTADAGVLGGHLEAFLEPRSLTLGHYPQSLTTSTVGGWIATRATGTASAARGGIERLVCGLEFVLPSGELVQIGPRPRAGGGLDAISLLCGSEGSLGVVTQVTLAVARRLPERRLAAAFPTFDLALHAQRSLIQARVPIGVLRVLNAIETAQISPPGSVEPGGSLLIASVEGEGPIVEAGAEVLARMVETSAGVMVDPGVAAAWWDHRFAPAGLIEGRNGRPGEMFDTIEVGTPWGAAASLSATLERTLAPLVRTLWLHSSHAYPTGTCLYLAFWIEAPDDATAVEVCRTVWQRTLAAVRDHGGSSAHHHGIGAARSVVYGESSEGRLHRLIKAAIDPQAVLAARLLDEPVVALSEGLVNG
jgi:alkyldihydroxyacetonephosphate synthase